MCVLSLSGFHPHPRKKRIIGVFPPNEPSHFQFSTGKMEGETRKRHQVFLSPPPGQFHNYFWSGLLPIEVYITRNLSSWSHLNSHCCLTTAAQLFRQCLRPCECIERWRFKGSQTWVYWSRYWLVGHSGSQEEIICTQDAGDWNWGLLHAKQRPSHWVIIPPPLTHCWNEAEVEANSHALSTLRPWGASMFSLHLTAEIQGAASWDRSQECLHISLGKFVPSLHLRRFPTTSIEYSCLPP